MASCYEKVMDKLNTSLRLDRYWNANEGASIHKSVVEGLKGRDSVHILMQSLYSLAKLVRSPDRRALNENLLTGVLAWTLERAGDLLPEILEVSCPIDESRRHVTIQELISDVGGLTDLDIRVDTSKGIGKEVGRLDLHVEGDVGRLLVENKVVEIGEPNGLNSEQVERYCRGFLSSALGSPWLFVCITPDTKHKAIAELRKLPDDLRSHVRWASWRDIWHVAKRLTDGSVDSKSDRYIIRELKAGIKMANLRPFEGFDQNTVELMRRISEMDEIWDLLEDVRTRLESPAGLNLKKKGTHRPTEGEVYVSEVYTHFIHKNRKYGDFNASIWYGPWLGLLDQEFGAFLGLYDKAFSEFSSYMEAQPETEKSINEAFRDFASQFKVNANLEKKHNRVEFGLTMPFSDERMHGPELVDFVVKCVEFLHDEIVETVFSHKDSNPQSSA